VIHVAEQDEKVVHTLAAARARSRRAPAVQAMLDAPMFGSRWRWNATRALAVLRARGGKKSHRSSAWMRRTWSRCVPDQLASPRTGGGPRDSRPPAGAETIADCLLEAMDFPA